MGRRGARRSGKTFTSRRRRASAGTAKAWFVALLAAPSAGLIATPAAAQLSYQSFQFDSSSVTTVTGIRANNMTGNYSIANSGGNTGGLLFNLSTGAISPFPTATANGGNFPGAISSTPYGPNFGSAAGILRVVGSYKTAESNPRDIGYLYDGAPSSGQQITTLFYPSLSFDPNSSTLNTIPHSNFGNQVVGNYDTRLINGNAFIYDIPSGTFTNNNRPNSASTTAYGVYGNRIAGGTADFKPGGGVGVLHGYIYNQSNGVFTLYDAPSPTTPGSTAVTAVTHFEGITSGGRANTFNLVADSVDTAGTTHAWAVHVDATGAATWTELAVPVPGAPGTTYVTSANSVYGNTVIGVYVGPGGVVTAFLTNIPGSFYNPVTNTGTLTASAPGAAAISVAGDDVMNSGTIQATGTNSVGITSGTYGAITNTGTISATGAGSTAVQMTGSFGTLLNAGLISAAPGAVAIGSNSTSVGTVVVNTGTIDGQVAIAAGPYARFENSGWMGISAAGAGVTHTTSGMFAQTSLGTLALRVGSNGVSDQLVVNGQAQLAGTALTVFQPGITFAKSYTLVSATNGLTGTFGTLSTQNLPGFLSGSLGYSPTSVTLNLQASLARLSGLGDHQRSVGRALDTAFNAGPGLGAMPALFSLTADQLPYALTVLSGSNASVGLSTDMAAGSQFTSLMTSRSLTRHADQQTAELAACEQAPACQATANEAPSNWSAWATAFGGGQWLNAEPTSGAPAAQQSIGGGAFGSDYHIGPQTVVGAAAGVSVSNYGVSYTSANGRATGAHFGIYGLHDMGTFYVNGALAYNRFDGSATRVIAGIGSTETEKSSAVSSQLAGRLEVGRPFEVAKFETGQVGVTPFVALQPAQLWTPAYTEWSVTQNGAPGVFALSYQAQGTTSLPTFLGAQLDGETVVNARPLKGWFRAAWVHEFLPDRGVTAGFTVLPGSTFSVDGARAASNAARFDLGVKYAVGNQTSLFANGNVELSDRGQSVGATVGLRIVW
jgi:subtilase-type serine protease